MTTLVDCPEVKTPTLQVTKVDVWVQNPGADTNVMFAAIVCVKVTPVWLGPVLMTKSVYVMSEPTETDDQAAVVGERHADHDAERCGHRHPSARVVHHAVHAAAERHNRGSAAVRLEVHRVVGDGAATHVDGAGVPHDRAVVDERLPS